METSPYTADEIPSEQETLTYTSVYADEADNPLCESGKSPGVISCALRYCDGTQFWMNRTGTELWRSGE